MKSLIITLALISIVYQGYSQDNYSHQFSSAPETVRYEIVQSDYGARYTLKIDKYSGKVFQLVSTDDGDLLWESILVLDNTKPDESTWDKVNFQLFTSGLGPRFTFLLNVNTGTTWQLMEDTESKVLFFSPLKGNP